MVCSGALLEFTDSRLDSSGGSPLVHNANTRPHLLLPRLHGLTNTHAQALVVLAQMHPWSTVCNYLVQIDSTCEAEFTLFGRVAQDIIGVSPQQAMLNNYRRDIPVTNLAVASTQIRHTPPELAVVVSWKYKFLIYVTDNSFHGMWASFNVHAVEGLLY